MDQLHSKISHLEIEVARLREENTRLKEENAQLRGVGLFMKRLRVKKAQNGISGCLSRHALWCISYQNRDQQKRLKST